MIPEGGDGCEFREESEWILPTRGLSAPMTDIASGIVLVVALVLETTDDEGENEDENEGNAGLPCCPTAPRSEYPLEESSLICERWRVDILNGGNVSFREGRLLWHGHLARGSHGLEGRATCRHRSGFWPMRRLAHRNRPRLEHPLNAGASVPKSVWQRLARLGDPSSRQSAAAPTCYLIVFR